LIISDLLNKLRQQGIIFDLKEGQLLCDAPKGAITQELYYVIKEHKKEIIQFLQLAKEQDDSFDKNYSYLFPIQRQGLNIPLFIIAGAHDTDDEFMRYLSNLVIHMGMSQPLYGLRPESIIKKLKAKITVQQMAQLYLKEIVDLNEDNPYFIIGECVGGILAYHVASELIKMGKQVPLLILMDTELPHFSYTLQYKLEILLEKLKRGLTILNQTFTFQGNKKEERIKGSKKSIKKLRLGYFYRRILFRYRPKPYPGQILLIKSSEEKNSKNYLGWDKVCNQITVQIVPGTHLTRLTQHSALLSNLILESMAKTIYDHSFCSHVS
jgi:thioesterase domain-containing protein